MANLKYRLYLTLWKINPIKKLTLDFLKATRFSDYPKLYSDLYLNDKFKVTLQNVSFYLFNEKYHKSSFDIYLNGIEKCWDRFSLRIWKGISEKSSIIIDIGTNIGLYCLTAKVSNKNAMVVGFEPSKKSFSIVKKNVEMNQLDIVLEKKALSNFNGSASFYDLDTHTAVASLKLNDNLKCRKLISYEVDIITLDNYVSQNNIAKVDLVSIDVEENEENVLSGMLQTIDTHRPTIIIEVLRNDLGIKIQNILDSYNYQYFFINEDGYLTKTKSLSKRPLNFIHSNNVLAVSREEIKDYVLENWG